MPRLNKTSTPAMLTSLGVAAGALASTPAEASVIVTHVGQSGGMIQGPSQLIVPLSGTGASLSFSARAGSIASHSTFQTSVFGVRQGQFLFEIKTSDGLNFAKPVPMGTRFDTGSGANSALMDIRSSSGGTFGTNTSGLQYFNFIFSTGGQDYTGWFSGSYNNISYYDVNFMVQSVAFDTTPDVFLGAGDTSISAPPTVPEPPSATLLALGAMVTGAAATRRYKRARRSA